MTQCEQGVHIIQKLPTGAYICVQCGLGFREHHALVVHGGTAVKTA